MKRFKEILFEKTIHFYDLDDTLFHHGDRTGIIIHSKGKPSKRLTTAQWSTYEKQPGDKLDYSEFRSSHTFSHSAQPIHAVLNHFKKTSNKQKVEILTGRGDLDDKDHFAQTMKNHGIDIYKNHVRRTGNMKTNMSTAERKAHHISQEINNKKYKSVHLYDDQTENLDHFLSLKDKHPDVKFHAHHIQNGKIKRYK